MYKVCYIIGQLSKHGAEGQLYELVRGINRERFNPVVICLSQGGYWSKKIQSLNIHFIELKRTKNREFKRLFQLYKLLKEIKPDILHTFLFPANTYGRITAIINRIPIIIASERGCPTIGKDKNIFKACIDKILSLFSHAIICNSHNASAILVNKYFYDNIKVFTVHNGVNVNGIETNVATHIQTKSTHKVIAIVGSLVPVKNHILFLDMARAVLDMTNNNIKFLVVGDGPLRGGLEEYAKKLGIEQYIDFTGERTDVIKQLQSVDIFVLTSLHEGLSNAIIEAMKAGLPVVATDVGGNNELVIDGETGFLCPSNDTTCLSEKIYRLLNDPDKAKIMGEKGEKRVLHNFRMEKMIRKTENIYSNLLESKNL